jgi:hypothetical protein
MHTFFASSYWTIFIKTWACPWKWWSWMTGQPLSSIPRFNWYRQTVCMDVITPPKYKHADCQYTEKLVFWANEMGKRCSRSCSSAYLGTTLKYESVSATSLGWNCTIWAAGNTTSGPPPRSRPPANTTAKGQGQQRVKVSRGQDQPGGQGYTLRSMTW